MKTDRAWRITMTGLALLLACVGARAATDVRWRCEVVYQPAREVWSREVTLTHDDKRLTRVAIDGMPVYTFSVYEKWILTSQDNERVQIDVATRTWHSDFRGVASGEGRCEPM
jgi:hypothetical protein